MKKFSVILGTMSLPPFSKKEEQELGFKTDNEQKAFIYDVDGVSFFDTKEELDSFIENEADPSGFCWLVPNEFKGEVIFNKDKFVSGLTMESFLEYHSKFPNSIV